MKPSGDGNIYGGWHMSRIEEMRFSDAMRRAEGGLPLREPKERGHIPTLAESQAKIAADYETHIRPFVEAEFRRRHGGMLLREWAESLGLKPRKDKP